MIVDSEKTRLVFVSHSGEDTWVARQIAREISSRGAHPFLDEADIDVGAELGAAPLISQPQESTSYERNLSCNPLIIREGKWAGDERSYTQQNSKKI